MATATPPPKADAPADPKTYYGYLFQNDKAPTPLFAAFMRAMAQYIVGVFPLLLPAPRAVAPPLDCGAVLTESAHRSTTSATRTTRRCRRSN